MMILKDLLFELAEVERIVGERDLQSLQPENLVLFTGKGTRSEQIHLGHEYLFELISTLSVKLKIPVYFQVATDEKRHEAQKYLPLSKIKTQSKLLIEELSTFNFFNPTIFSNSNPMNMILLKNISNYIGHYIPIKKFLSVFGNITAQKCEYALMQISPVFLFSKILNKTTIVITADDQLQYFLLLRDIAMKLKIPKPIIVVLKGVSSLKDSGLKMSSKDKKGCAFSDDAYKGILKSYSAPEDLTKDFAFNLCTKHIKISSEPIKAKFEKIKEEYILTKRSKQFKLKLIELLNLKKQSRKNNLKSSPLGGQLLLNLNQVKSSSEVQDELFKYLSASEVLLGLDEEKKS